MKPYGILKKLKSSNWGRVKMLDEKISKLRKEYENVKNAKYPKMPKDLINEGLGFELWDISTDLTEFDAYLVGFVQSFLEYGKLKWKNENLIAEMDKWNKRINSVEILAMVQH